MGSSFIDFHPCFQTIFLLAVNPLAYFNYHQGMEKFENMEQDVAFIVKLSMYIVVLK